MAANTTSEHKLTLLLGGQLIPLAVEEIDQVLDAIINQNLASRKPEALRCCFIENVNWLNPPVKAERSCESASIRV